MVFDNGVRGAEDMDGKPEGERMGVNFGGDDLGVRHEWVLVPFHLIEIISRLCCFVHLRIWNGTKERNTDTAA